MSTVSYRRIILLQGRSGPDEIFLELDLPSGIWPYTEQCSASIKTAKGHGLEWCKLHLREPDEIINV